MNFWEIAETGDVDSLLNVLKDKKSKVNVNERHPRNAWQAIHLACRAAQAPIVETLVCCKGIQLDKEVCSMLFELLYNTVVSTAENITNSNRDVALIESP